MVAGPRIIMSISVHVMQMLLILHERPNTKTRRPKSCDAQSISDRLDCDPNLMKWVKMYTQINSIKLFIVSGYKWKESFSLIAEVNGKYLFQSQNSIIDSIQQIVEFLAKINF